MYVTAAARNLNYKYYHCEWGRNTTKQLMQDLKKNFKNIQENRIEGGNAYVCKTDCGVDVRLGKDVKLDCYEEVLVIRIASRRLCSIAIIPNT